MPDTHRASTHLPVFPGGLSLCGPHRIGAFCLCAQLEAFAHELRLTPVISKESTYIGNLVHVGLAYRYAAMMPQRPSWFVYPDGRWAIWACGQDRLELALEALSIFDAYEAYYTVNIWTPLLVEHQFRVDFASGPYTARTDLLALENGEIALIDHKTSTRLKGAGAIAAEYRADRQMLTGLALARASGWDVKRVIINAMSREIPPRFRRVDIPISPLAYEHLGQDTAYYIDRLAEVRRLFPDPMNRPRNLDACYRKYGPCEFIPLCTDGPHRMNEYMTR